MFPDNAEHLASSPLHFSSPSASPAESSPTSVHRASDDDWVHLSDQLRDRHLVDDDIVPGTTADSQFPIRFRHVEPRETRTTSTQRESSRRRVPAPDVPSYPPPRNTYREPSYRQTPRRSSSELSDSVGSHEGYPGFDPRNQYPAGYQWAHSNHSAAQYPPSVLPQAYNQPPPMQAPPVGHQQHLMSFVQPDPWGFYGPNAFASPYAYSPAPSIASQQTGYFPGDPRGALQPYSMPMMPYNHALSYPHGASSSASTASDDRKIDRLEEFMLKQEQTRLAREEAREIKLEADKLAAEAKAAKEAEDRKAAEALANAAKAAKEAAEAKAAEREAEYEKAHKEALDDANKKLEAAKAAEKKAKQEADAHKPTEDSLKGPLKFKDAVGRKFSFPWQVCKTWKGMEYLINQAFLPIANLGPRVRDGQYDLMGPDGEIILPTVWETTVKPDWSITMTMWPMPEPKKVEPPKMAPMSMPMPMPMPMPMQMPQQMPQQMPLQRSMSHADRPRRHKSKTRHPQGAESVSPPELHHGMMHPPLPPLMNYPDMMNSTPPVEIKHSSEKRTKTSSHIAVINGRKVMVRPKNW